MKIYPFHYSLLTFLHMHKINFIFLKQKEKGGDTPTLGRVPSLNNTLIKPEDAEGNINSQYCHQFVEFDAFVFSYSVMCLKYGELEYLSASLPKAFGEDFYHAVELCKQALNTCI